MVVQALAVELPENEHHPNYREEIENIDRPVVITGWHYSVLGFITFAKKITMTVMVSASEDGDYVAALVRRVGFAVVRGSSNRKGMIAAKELIREMRKGKNAAIVADGSQGPARVLQSGPLLLAAKSGRVVFPVVWSASHYFAFDTWDRLVLPKPFSKLDFVYGEPFFLPEGLKANQLEEYRLELENRMNELYEEAWAIYGKSTH